MANTRSKKGSVDLGNTVNSDHLQLILDQQAEKYDSLLELQAKNFKSFLESFMQATNKRIDTFMLDINTSIIDLKNSLEFTQSEYTETKRQLQSLDSSHTELHKLETKFTNIEDSLDYLENQSRRNNLRFEGITEKPGESWHDTEQTLRTLIKEKMKLDVSKLEIERAHRVGNKTRSTPRPIVARFLRYKDRDVILKNGSKLKGTNVFVNDDVSDRVQRRRREQHDEMKDYRRRGFMAYFNMDKLVVKPPRGRQGEQADLSQKHGKTPPSSAHPRPAEDQPPMPEREELQEAIAAGP